ncbi:SNF2 family N-terminal domain-containing protein [Chytridium lagenaria]|nr:SNF2 family N-terminal domain-containing protein [Chytridium lagenaria]
MSELDRNENVKAVGKVMEQQADRQQQRPVLVDSNHSTFRRGPREYRSHENLGSKGGMTGAGPRPPSVESSSSGQSGSSTGSQQYRQGQDKSRDMWAYRDSARSEASNNSTGRPRYNQYRDPMPLNPPPTHSRPHSATGYRDEGYRPFGSQGGGSQSGRPANDHYRGPPQPPFSSAFGGAQAGRTNQYRAPVQQPYSSAPGGSQGARFYRPPSQPHFNGSTYRPQANPGRVGQYQNNRTGSENSGHSRPIYSQSSVNTSPKPRPQGKPIAIPKDDYQELPRPQPFRSTMNSDPTDGVQLHRPNSPYWKLSNDEKRRHDEEFRRMQARTLVAQPGDPENKDDASVIRHLMDSISNDGASRESASKPEELTVDLFTHQREGLAWLKKQEATVKAAILADDMGLGKTIQSISLILASKPKDGPKTTLIITTLSLLRQWEKEILTKTTKSALSVALYHGPSRLKSAKELLEFDVVITTYSTVAVDYSPEPSKNGVLFDCDFLRVILDEAQVIKNHKKQDLVCLFFTEVNLQDLPHKARRFKTTSTSCTLFSDF